MPFMYFIILFSTIWEMIEVDKADTIWDRNNIQPFDARITYYVCALCSYTQDHKSCNKSLIIFIRIFNNPRACNTEFLLFSHVNDDERKIVLSISKLHLDAYSNSTFMLSKIPKVITFNKYVLRNAFMRIGFQ